MRADKEKERSDGQAERPASATCEAEPPVSTPPPCTSPRAQGSEPSGETDPTGWDRQEVRLGGEDPLSPARQAGEPESGFPCAKHPGSEPLLCVPCQKVFCAECAPARRYGWMPIHFCPRCGALGEAVVAVPGGAGRIGGTIEPDGAPAHGPVMPSCEELLDTMAFPFRDIGALTALFWSIVIYVAWPLHLLLFIPYLWATFRAGERGRECLPMPWRIGGNPVLWTWQLVRLALAPGLPLGMCLAFLAPSTPQSPAAPLGIRIVAGLALAGIVPLAPLVAVIVMRTGNPLVAMDPRVLNLILKRGRDDYLRLLLTILAILALVVALHAILEFSGIDARLPEASMVLDMRSPRGSLVVPWVLGHLWVVGALARFSRQLPTVVGTDS